MLRNAFARCLGGVYAPAGNAINVSTLYNVMKGDVSIPPPVLAETCLTYMTKEAALVAQVATLTEMLTSDAKLLASKDELLAQERKSLAEMLTSDAKLLASKDELLAQERKSLAEMRATDAKALAEMLASDAKLLASKDELLAQERKSHYTLLAQERKSHAAAIAAKDDVFNLTELRWLSDAKNSLLLLSRVQIVLQPRIMIEIALAAKYPTVRSASARWNKFYETHVVDASGQLLGEPEKIMLAIDCTLHASAVRDDLKTIFNRLSDLVHNRLHISGFAAGICCGGDSSGCANAIAVKLLQDDLDVQAAGLLTDDVLFLTPDFSHTRTFKCDGTIVKPDGVIVKPAKASDDGTSISS
jgi:hypothetical protein